MTSPRSLLALSSTVALRRGRQLVEEILRKKQRIAEDFYDVGSALSELEKKQLWRALGHESFAEMLDARRLLARSQAFKLMAIARALPRRAALSMGTEKSYALVRYAAATAEIDSPASLLASGIRIGGRKKSVDDISANELVRETQRTRTNRDNARRDPARTSARELATAGARSLSKTLGERVDVKPTRVPQGWAVVVTMSIGAFTDLVRRVEK
ncbi:MAG: hypothetical protein ABI183_23915 [Polyangiaceae bacterium]